MMAFFESTIGRILLIGFVIGVWGINVCTFSEIGDQSAGVSTLDLQAIDIDDLVIPENVDYVYRSSDRDPFFRGRIRPPVPEENLPQQEPERVYVQPVLTLNGIFDDMVVITDEFGGSFFLKEGDRFKDGIKVEKIYQDSVILYHSDHTISLVINN